MAVLSEIAQFTGEYLRAGEISDYAGALNGVQLENSGEVTHIAAAVDAHLPTVRAAVARKANLLLVHHGMFWQGAQTVTGPVYQKLKLAIGHDLAVISYHLPLDAHPEVGNNACLAKALGLEGGDPFLCFKGNPIGLRFDTEWPRDDLAAELERVVGGPVHVCAAGPEQTKHIGICSGGAGDEIYQAAAAGIDTFISGEGQHWTHTSAEELGVNLFYGGHYATETFGVKALAGLLADRFELTWEFLSHPTGL